MGTGFLGGGGRRHGTKTQSAFQRATAAQQDAVVSSFQQRARRGIRVCIVAILLYYIYSLSYVCSLKKKLQKRFVEKRNKR